MAMLRHFVQRRVALDRLLFGEDTTPMDATLAVREAVFHFLDRPAGDAGVDLESDHRLH